MNSEYRGYQPIAKLSKTSQTTKNKVIEMYLNGSSQTQIEKTLKMTRKTIRTILKEAGIDRTKSQQWRIRHGSTLNEEVFDLDKLTPEAEYWIGFLYTDGHISDGKRGFSIEVTLHKQDRHHLQKFLDFVGSNNKIHDHKTKQQCRIRIGSEKLHKALQRLGFDNQKSYTAKPNEFIKNSRHFWRGVIDGDGGIYKRKDNCRQISLCGTIDTITGFINFCETLGINNRKTPTRCFGRCLYQVSYYGSEAFIITNHLYKDATVYLDRKYQIYLQEFNATNAA